MSSAGRPVPWANWTDWLEVYKWLDSSDAHDVQKGLDKVAAWRCRGRVPLGVDMHACLLDVQMRDPGQLLGQAASSHSHDDVVLRMQYAMVIVRLVNGIADSGQKGRTANSVASITAAVGLPRVLVDLRHEATHNELPSLPLLRAAADAALAWLHATYWEPQQHTLRSAAERIATILREIVSLHNHAISHNGAWNASIHRDHAPGSDACYSQLKSLVPPAAAVLLVQPLMQHSGLQQPQLPSAPGSLHADLSDRQSPTWPPSVSAGRDLSCPPGLRQSQVQVQVQKWQEIMCKLQQDWSALPALCLAAAVDHLLKDSPLREVGVAWAIALLQSAPQPGFSFTSSPDKGSQGGKGGKNQPAMDPIFRWEPTAQQLSQLLKDCLHSSAQGDSGTDAKSGMSDANGGPLSGGDMDVQPCQNHVVDVMLLLSACLGDVAAATAQSAITASVHMDLTEGIMPGQSGLSPPSRWRRVRTWTPCAIGALPSVHDPNGASAFPAELRLGSVALPPSDAQPSPFVESEAKDGERLQCLSSAGSEQVLGLMPESGRQHHNAPESKLCTEDISLW